MSRDPGRPLRILISAGPTREPIDPVRYVSNYSTGYMGALLTAEALRRGHRVTVVRGPTIEPFPRRAKIVPVESSTDMAQAIRRWAPSADAIIMAAAVADFRPARRSRVKLTRTGSRSIKLEATPDILGGLPRRRGQVVAGFALESARVVERARRKLHSKRADLLLAQQAGAGRGPFGRHPVRAWLLAREGSVRALGSIRKASVSRLLLDKIEALWYGQRS